MSRSAALGLALSLGLASGLGIASSGCARIVYNAAPVLPGVVYRSAQPTPWFLARAHARHGFRSIVNLRGHTDGFESAFAAKHGIQLHVLNLSSRRAPSAADVERFLAILADEAAHPVLVHCRNGVDRTGYMIGLYRRTQGWSEADALAEMRRFFQFATVNAVPQRVVRQVESERPTP